MNQVCARPLLGGRATLGKTACARDLRIFAVATKETWGIGEKQMESGRRYFLKAAAATLSAANMREHESARFAASGTRVSERLARITIQRGRDELHPDIRKAFGTPP